MAQVKNTYLPFVLYRCGRDQGDLLCNAGVVDKEARVKIICCVDDAANICYQRF